MPVSPKPESRRPNDRPPRYGERPADAHPPPRRAVILRARLLGPQGCSTRCSSSLLESVPSDAVYVWGRVESAPANCRRVRWPYRTSCDRRKCLRAGPRSAGPVRPGSPRSEPACPRIQLREQVREAKSSHPFVAGLDRSASAGRGDLAVVRRTVPA